MMLQQSLLLAALPRGVLDMTTDFTPLFMGMVIRLFLCVLALAFAIGVHDSRGTQRPVTQPNNRPKPVPEFSDAA